MAIHKEYQPDQKTNFDLGFTTLYINEKHYTSSIVYFKCEANSGIVHARSLQAVDSPDPVNDSNSLAISLLGEQPNAEFEQCYERDVTDHGFSWNIFLKGVAHTPTAGTVTGKFSKNYNEITTIIELIFADGNSGRIEFTAKKR